MTFDELPPVMRELFKMLPPPDSEWPAAERLRWLRAFEAVCRLVYRDDGPGLVIEMAARDEALRGTR
jgi:hypothetical protein